MRPHISVRRNLHEERIMARPILVVDDDEDTRAMLDTCLSLLGQEVVTASNASEGLSRARQSHPCVILLDYMMPGMSGSDFRVLQLSDNDIADIPVLLTTAHPEGCEIADELDVDALIEKPVALEELVELVERYCTPEALRPTAPR